MNAPKYQVMRDLTQGEYDELKQSIIENGVLVPVITDERGHIIDGHHRKKICDELGITNYPRSIKMRLTEEQKIEMAYQLNEARRQLTPEEKRQMAEKRLRETPEISDRQIAKQIGASNVFVSGVRKEMEQSGQLLSINSSIGADGKERPRQVERKSGDVITVITSTDPDGIGEYLDAIQTDIEDEDVEDEDDDDPDDDTPTLRVISLAGHERRKEEQDRQQHIDGDKKYKELDKAIAVIDKLDFSDEDFEALLHWHRDMDEYIDDSLDGTVRFLASAIAKLKNIHTKLILLKGKIECQNRKSTRR